MTWSPYWLYWLYWVYSYIAILAILATLASYIGYMGYIGSKTVHFGIPPQGREREPLRRDGLAREGHIPILLGAL